MTKATAGAKRGKGSLEDELAREAARLQRAEEVLGHPFRDRSLLLRALTHRSYINEHPEAAALGHNERLELLGDAVLSLVTFDALLAASPEAQEGELSERHHRHVCEPTLAAAGARAGVGALLRVGRGELVGSAELSPSIRADAVEALLGAVYQDGGLEAARAATERLLGPPPLSARQGPSAKTILQERLQKLVGALPEYVAGRKDGPDHAPVFFADVLLFGRVIGRGEGGNKRTATEAAAAAALADLQGLDDEALRRRLSDGAR